MARAMLTLKVGFKTPDWRAATCYVLPVRVVYPEGWTRP
jgi:hypothetical protein